MSDFLGLLDRGEPGYAITVLKVGSIPNQHWTVVHGHMEVSGVGWTRKGAIRQARRAARQWQRDAERRDVYTEHLGPTAHPPVPVAANAPFTDYDG